MPRREAIPPNPNEEAGKGWIWIMIAVLTIVITAILTTPQGINGLTHLLGGIP